MGLCARPPRPDLCPVRGAGGFRAGRLVARPAERWRHLLAHPRRGMDAGAPRAAARRCLLLHRGGRALAHPGMAGRNRDGAGLARLAGRASICCSPPPPALTAGVVGWFVRRRVDFVPALLAVVLGLCCVTGSLLARPHMLALPLLAIWTAGLVRRAKKRAPALLADRGDAAMGQSAWQLRLRPGAGRRAGGGSGDRRPQTVAAGCGPVPARGVTSAC